MADWGWDWTDCCTVKSNVNNQPGAMQPPRAPIGSAPHYDQKNAAMRDTFNTPQFDEKGTGVKNVYRFPSDHQVAAPVPQSSMYSSQMGQGYASGQGYNSVPMNQPPARATSQMGQHTSVPSQQNVGLGIAFQQKLTASDTPRPKLAVKSLAVGSPAYACGQIQVGDVLHSIGDVYVKGMSGAEIAPFILGPPGSAIHMAFERPMPDGSFRMVHVDLTRTWTHVGTAPPAAQPVLLRQFGAN